MEMTLQKKLEKMAGSIKKNLSEMDSTFMNLSFRNEHVHMNLDPEDERLYEEQEITEQLEEQFQFYAKRVFWSGLVFFELQQLLQLRAEFITEMKPLLDDKEALLEAGYAQDAGEEYSITAMRFRNYFLPFAEFMEYAEEEEQQLTGIKTLETILKGTASIVRQMGVTPAKEADVYKAVKVVLTAVFPRHQQVEFIFQKDAKCYQPDILLPALETAIEYKYASSEKALNDTMDQIFTDVHGYSSHPQYHRFYAVFYVKAGEINQERFEILWSGKKFPRNWHGIFVEGF